MDLQRSPFLSVVSEERTQHVLRLMAKAGTHGNDARRLRARFAKERKARL